MRGKPAGEHLLIVDDVITTGATIHEIARTLRRAGVPRISALAVARA
jgi:predicted amidophosphoribosyltransferase